MLDLIIGDGTWYPKKMVWNASTLFDMVYENDWMEDDLVKDMILDIDKSKVIRPRIIESPVLGDITPKEISGGVKLVILMLKWDDDIIYSLNNCGDNCARWIQEVSAIRDNTAYLAYPMIMSDVVPLNLHILNNNSYPKDLREYMGIYARYCNDDWETFYRNTNSKIEVQDNS